MKRKLFIALELTFLLLVNFTLLSQPIEKGCFYIQSSGYYNYSYQSIVQTYDGNYLVGAAETGFAGSNNLNFWVFKIDAAGSLLWSSSLGATTADGCYKLIETSDHKIIAAGYAGTQDFFVVRYDEDGTIIWEKNIDHGAGQAYIKSIAETPDGEFVLAGVSGSNAFLCRIDADGNKVWSTEINDGGPYDVIINDVVASTTGGYLISGYRTVLGAIFSHVNEGGEVQWSISYYNGTAFDAVALDDGGYLISGYETGVGLPGYNAFVMKIDSSGNSVWGKTYGGDDAEAFYGLYPTSDGGFIGAGTADTTGNFSFGSEHGFVVKCNSSGEAEWSKKVNSTAFITDVIQTDDGGYALLGNRLIVKLDANGNACDECLLEDFGTWMEGGTVAPKTMLNEAAGDSIFNSTYTEYTGGTEYELCVVTGVEEPLTHAVFSIAPNPADQFVVCSFQWINKEGNLLKIFDATGRVILYSKSETLNSKQFVDVSNWQNGVYFCQVSSGDETAVAKLIVDH